MGVFVAVFIAVAVAVAVLVAVLVGVLVAVFVAVGVAVFVLVGVGVATPHAAVPTKSAFTTSPHPDVAYRIFPDMQLPEVDGTQNVQPAPLDTTHTSKYVLQGRLP